MKKLLFFLLLISTTLHSQTRYPFGSKHKEIQTITLTNGKYDEFFDEDTLQRVGSSVININTKKITKIKLSQEEIDELENAQATRFLSVDPKANQFVSESPYIFVSNSPLIFIDPTGGFKIPVHKSITEYALGLISTDKLSKSARADIIFGNTLLADILGANTDWHFDGRKNFEAMQGTWKGLNEGIDELSKNFGWYNKKVGGDDARRLGAMLHTIQDFYAHSNYVELYIQYYQDTHNGDLPVLSNVPLYEDALNDQKFTDGYLKPNLKSGEFNTVDYIKGKDVEKTHKKGETHHNDIAKDNKEMGKIIKSKDGKKSVNTHDVAVDLAKRKSEKVVKKVISNE